jgi:hypothetical protein
MAGPKRVKKDSRSLENVSSFQAGKAKNGVKKSKTKKTKKTIRKKKQAISFLVLW